jgi:hypothetical protein
MLARLIGYENLRGAKLYWRLHKTLRTTTKMIKIPIFGLDHVDLIKTGQ